MCQHQIIEEVLHIRELRCFCVLLGERSVGGSQLFDRHVPSEASSVPVNELSGAINHRKKGRNC